MKLGLSSFSKIPFESKKRITASFVGVKKEFMELQETIGVDGTSGATSSPLKDVLDLSEEKCFGQYKNAGILYQKWNNKIDTTSGTSRPLDFKQFNTNV